MRTKSVIRFIAGEKIGFEKKPNTAVSDIKQSCVKVNLDFDLIIEIKTGTPKKTHLNKPFSARYAGISFQKREGRIVSFSTPEAKRLRHTGHSAQP